MEIRSIGNSVQPGFVPVDNGAPAPAPAVSATGNPGESALQVNAPSATTAPQPPAAPSEAQLTQAVKDINKAMETISPGLVFAVDPDSNRTVVKVVDQKTNQVIKQIPSKQILALDSIIDKRIDQLQGLLLQVKA
jgi:flagellar protein FlaG